MKAIIDQIIYDTETAQEYLSWWNGLSLKGCHYYLETLYRMRNGAWFLHGEGGAQSPYAQTFENGNASSAGEKIIPITGPEAADWLAKHGRELFKRTSRTRPPTPEAIPFGVSRRLTKTPAVNASETVATIPSAPAFRQLHNTKATGEL